MMSSIESPCMRRDDTLPRIERAAAGRRPGAPAIGAKAWAQPEKTAAAAVARTIVRIGVTGRGTSPYGAGLCI